MSNIFQSMLTAFTAAVIVLVADRVIPRAEPVQVGPEASESWVLLGTWKTWGFSENAFAITQEFSSEAICEEAAELFRVRLNPVKEKHRKFTRITAACIPNWSPAVS